jgi:alcohol dehydrogenase class IV
MAINTAGTAGAHAIQSPIGALTHTPHGFGISALLPYVMRYNLPARVPEFAEIGRILGVAAPSDSEEQHCGPSAWIRATSPTSHSRPCWLPG